MDALAREPLLRQVRDRHPDVDIVVLPPEDPIPPDTPPLTVGQARTLVADVRAALDDLFRRIGQEPAATADTWPAGSRAEVRRFQVRASVRDLVDPVEVLRDIGDTLLASGWRAVPTGDAPPELEARRGPLRLRATAYERSVDVLVRTPYTRVPDATLRELGR